MAVSALSCAQLEPAWRVLARRLSHGRRAQSARVHLVGAQSHARAHDHVLLAGAGARSDHVEFRHRLVRLQPLLCLPGRAVQAARRRQLVAQALPLQPRLPALHHTANAHHQEGACDQRCAGENGRACSRQAVSRQTG